MVQRKSLHKLETMKTNANGNREMYLKSVKTKCFYFCKCVWFFEGRNISIEAICDVKTPINVKRLHFSHNSGNNFLVVHLDCCGCCRSSNHFVTPISHFFNKKPLYLVTFPNRQQRGIKFAQIRDMQLSVFICPQHTTEYLWKTWRPKSIWACGQWRQKSIFFSLSYIWATYQKLGNSNQPPLPACQALRGEIVLSPITY